MRGVPPCKVLNVFHLPAAWTRALITTVRHDVAWHRHLNHAIENEESRLLIVLHEVPNMGFFAVTPMLLHLFCPFSFLGKPQGNLGRTQCSCEWYPCKQLAKPKFRGAVVILEHEGARIGIAKRSPTATCARGNAKSIPIEFFTRIPDVLIWYGTARKDWFIARPYSSYITVQHRRPSAIHGQTCRYEWVWSWLDVD